MKTLLQQLVAITRRRFAACAVLIALLTLNPAVFAQTSLFTYQGQLTDNGAPANGTYDFQFTLFDMLTGGSSVAGPLAVTDVAVNNGLFTVTLDFGIDQFNGLNRWLEIAARTNDAAASFGMLLPRQRITSTPYAITALTANNLSGSVNVPAGQVSGTLNTAQIPSLNASKITSGIFNTAHIPNLSAAKMDSGTLLDARLSANVALLNRNPQTFSGENHFSGDVGIGTISPNSRLQVDGDGVSPSLRVRVDANSKLTVAINGGTTIGINNDTPPANGLYVSGNVGIGTASPALKLSVAGSGLYNSANAAAILLTNTTANGHGWEWHALDSGSLQLVDFTVGASGGRMLIDTNGDVNFGDDSPQGNLNVGGDGNGVQGVVVVNRIGSDGNLIRFRRDAITIGEITVTGGVISYNAFSGSHYGWMPQRVERGTLVRLTGDNRRPRNEGEIVYGVAPTSQANDPACLGAYLAPHPTGEASAATDQHQIMSVGNGELWVTENVAGDLRPGDFLISSPVAGCAMKDNPDQFPVGYICARAGEGVKWSAVSAGANGTKRTRISVLWESFVRDSRGAASLATVKAQQEQIGRLESDLKSLRATSDRLARLEALLLNKDDGALQAAALKGANQ